MEGLETLTTILHVIGCTFLILVVLLQSGKGGGMGAAFGGGGGGAVFGGRGAGNFLTRVTTVLAVVFMATSMILSWMSSQERSVIKSRQERQREAPVERQLEGEAADETAPEGTDTAPEGADAAPEGAEAPAEGVNAPAGEAPPAEGDAAEPAPAAGEGAEAEDAGETP